MKLNKLRNKIAYFIATDKAKKRFDEGVTDDNFYDFSFYVDLIAKSLRRFADDRGSYTPMGWKLDPEIETREELEAISESHTVLLHKWADILEIELDVEEPYYKEFNDHLEGMSVQGLEIVFPEHTEESKKKHDDFNNHEVAIFNLKSDILAEIGEHYMYFWD